MLHSLTKVCKVTIYQRLIINHFHIITTSFTLIAITPGGHIANDDVSHCEYISVSRSMTDLNNIVFSFKAYRGRFFSSKDRQSTPKWDDVFLFNFTSFLTLHTQSSRHTNCQCNLNNVPYVWRF